MQGLYMANVNHSSLTDPYLHEPKGVATAASGDIYIANGSGSGSWTPAHQHADAYLAFDATTPAYVHAATTSFTVINPTLVSSSADGFTVSNSPNARITYTGTRNLSANIHIAISTTQATGTNKNVEWQIHKNGSLLAGSHVIRTISSGSWGSVALLGNSTFETDDYLEIFSKIDSAGNVNYASIFWTVKGLPA
jgi:hypothetical protein